MYGKLLAQVNPQLAPLVRVMREAASTDPDVAAALSELKANRLDGMSEFATILASRGARRRGAKRQATHAMWAIAPTRRPARRPPSLRKLWPLAAGSTPAGGRSERRVRQSAGSFRRTGETRPRSATDADEFLVDELVGAEPAELAPEA